MFKLQQVEHSSPSAELKAVTLWRQLMPKDMTPVTVQQRALFFEPPGSSDANVHVFGPSQKKTTSFTFEWEDFMWDRQAVRTAGRRAMGFKMLISYLESMVREYAVCRVTFLGMARKCLLLSFSYQPLSPVRYRVVVGVRFLSDDFSIRKTNANVLTHSLPTIGTTSAWSRAALVEYAFTAAIKDTSLTLEQTIDKAISDLSTPVFEAKLTLLGFLGKAHAIYSLIQRMSQIPENLLLGGPTSLIIQSVIKDLKHIHTALKFDREKKINWSAVARYYYERTKLESIFSAVERGVRLSIIRLGNAMPQTTSQTYLVRPGDTLVSVSAVLGIDWQILFRMNKLHNTALFPGQRLTY